MFLEVSPDIVCNIILKAREFHAKEEIHLPEEPPELTDDWYEQVLADYENDLSLQEVKAMIKDLEPIQQASLVALFWIGRGDFDVKEWRSALKEAKRNWNEYTAEYLLSRPLVADYLQEGLCQIGYNCEA